MTGDRRSEWQVGRTISVGHIITTVALVVAGFTFIYDLREQVAVAEFRLTTFEKRMEEINVTHERRMERQEGRNKDQFGQIMDHLYRLENKIDQLFSSNKSVEQKGSQ